MSKITRRDFLKLTATTTSAILLPRAISWLDTSRKQSDSLPNIVILLFDAMTAKNLSLYGYPRLTSPNFNPLIAIEARPRTAVPDYAVRPHGRARHSIQNP